MTTYISILRGINVSGQRMIKMDMLKRMYEDLNFKNVQTYIQSGNVIFQDDNPERGQLEPQISSRILKQFGFEVPVIVLSIDELKGIIVNNPFMLDKNKDVSFLHVTFLSSRPERIDLDIIMQKQTPGEEFVVTGRVIYLYCPYGYGKTKLNNTFFESKLKTGATTRNWNTTNELLLIAENMK